ncbi:MAG TPA: phosphatidylglycerophosphatase A [Polyangiaceae bacterium]|nr:phosphatidylglycerophosphatase A [Polyangiaceae bacterium]
MTTALPAVGWLPPGRDGASVRGRLGDVAAWVVSHWFGCGLVPKAPGTAGTVGALPLYLLVRPLGFGALVATALAVTIAGVIASSRVARLSRQKDPQFVCVDEVAGVLIAWLAAPAGALGILSGFILFRLFDTWKPFPARNLERLSGGMGIVMDDVAAGLWSAAVLGFLRYAGWL